LNLDVIFLTMQSEKQFEKQLETQLQKLLSWHSFLRISSTYSLAIKLKAGAMKRKERETLPADFDQVLQTYDKFDDVWAETAESWFGKNALTALKVIKGANQPKILSSLFAGNEEKTAISLAKHVVGAWEQQGKQPELLISIPLNARRGDIYKLIDEALDDLQDDVNKSVVPKGQDMAEQLSFKLMDTKVRMAVLQKMHKLVTLRATQPELLNWQLAQHLGLSPAHVEKVAKAQSLKQSSNSPLQTADRATGEKLIINSEVGRYMRKAFLLAENAAYGRFPCFDELPKVDGKIVKTSFDYKAIANGMSREYYRQHGKQPDKNEFREECGYYPELDKWWEDNYYRP
jgi:hypothetical protein